MKRYVMMACVTVFVACARASTSGAGNSQADAGATHSAADAGKPADDATTTLCDGSDDMRFGFDVAGGGLIPDTETFGIPFGFSGFFVDGSCHYYALSDAWRGAIVSGTLSTSDAKQLSDDVGWKQLDSWRSFQSPPACADGSATLLIKPGASASCVCGCGDRAPAGLEQALAAAERWRMRLVSTGTPVSGAMSAFAVPSELMTGQARAWPLTRSMQSIANLLLMAHDPKLIAGPYARFDDPSDSDALRALRDLTDTRSPQGLSRVSEAGETFDLYTRDELPDATTRAIKMLIDTSVHP